MNVCSIFLSGPNRGLKEDMSCSLMKLISSTELNENSCKTLLTRLTCIFQGCAHSVLMCKLENQTSSVLVLSTHIIIIIILVMELLI